MKPTALSLSFFLLFAFFGTIGAQTPTNILLGGKCTQGDCLNGYGVYEYDNGDCYKGDWKDGKMHGQGTYTYANKCVYSGQYQDDERHGYGTFTWPEGDMYVGDYFHNKRHGYGMYITAQGLIQEGRFEDGKAVQVTVRKQGLENVKRGVDSTKMAPAVVAKTPVIQWITPSMEEVTGVAEYEIKACVQSLSEIRLVEYFLNKRPYMANRGFVVEEEGECPNTLKRAVPLQVGPNVIEIKVTNADGLVAVSESKVITYNEKAAAQAAPVARDARTALVIGNTDYKDVPLKNSVNDATAMAKALEELGFEVTLLLNADQLQMKKAFREFGMRIKERGGTGMFYFSGHGIQARGNNYLLPVGADIRKEADLEYEAVDMGRMVVEMEFAANPMNIIILDACRDNPYAEKFQPAGAPTASAAGLTAIERVPAGTFIAYSTAPGSVASDGEGTNGLYTQELLKTIKTPGLRIEDVFKQVRSSVRKLSKGAQIPWENSSIESDFYFVP
jgi:hypothetical protein